ncbi:hypothetical protein [Proteiniclasticum ruminis]|uniref:hypothetical protein n=1 Tax=Proteiniclasticum ruminis TaxID=398199 RepID=UPI0028AEFF68|nr:hypothetical protein [Proteiniclasticum ruminis]
MSNYKDWIKNIDIDIDYFSAFMKAWIAFNSWYRYEFGSGSDKSIIEKIKDSNNRFRTHMTNLLASQEAEGIRFKDNLSNLHAALCNAACTTQEYGGVKKQISFSEIAIKNTNQKSEHTYGQFVYKTFRSNAKFKTEIKHKDNGSIRFQFEQDGYDEEELFQQTDYKKLTLTQKNQCEICYEELSPYLIESIIFLGDISEGEEHYTKIGAYNFVNDNEKIGKSIVEVLYLLRCSLAHGDVAPDECSNNVYRYAYNILSMALKKLL